MMHVGLIGNGEISNAHKEAYRDLRGPLMQDIKLGLQVYAVREAFAEDPVATLKRVADMGYQGVELNYWTMNHEPQFYVDALKEAGLACFSCMAVWKNLQPDALDQTIRTCKVLGAPSMVIGAVDATRLKEDPAYPKEAVDYMNYLLERLEKEGIRTGYHSHDMDSMKVEGEKSFYESVFENTPERFSMVMDTGNTQAGGDDPLKLMKQFPGRSPILHLKGYSKQTDYVTPMWESEMDWPALLTTAIDQCNTRTMIIEFGKRGDYEPFEWAEKSLQWLKGQLQLLGRM